MTIVRIDQMTKKRSHKKVKTGMNPAACEARDHALSIMPNAVIHRLGESVFVMDVREVGTSTIGARVSSPAPNEGSAWLSAAWRLREYDGNVWTVVTTKPSSDREVVVAYKELEITAYAPMETVWRNTTKRTAVRQPLLPGYVFAVIKPERIREAAHAGSTGKLAFTGRDIDLAEFVASLQAAERAGVFDHTFGQGKTFEVGQSVKIINGPYIGKIGAITRMKGSKKAAILLDLYGGKWPADVELSKLQAA